MWPQPSLLRGATARNTILLFALFFLTYHFRVWEIDYNLKSAPKILDPGPEKPTAPQVETSPPTDFPTDLSSLDGSAPATPSPPSSPSSPSSPSDIPKTIWYKLGPKGLSEDAKGWTSSCISQNPGYHAEFVTDESAHAFVNEKFANRRDIVDAYNALTVPILRADLLRYLLLYAEGGVWFDLDASCEGTPIDEWVPAEYREDASLVVGWEFDGGYHFEFERQFVTWTVLAKKGSPHLMVVVEDILASIREIAAANNVSIEGIRMNMIKDVVDFTGPKQFARSVMRDLEKTLGEKGKWNGWDEYHEILEPKMAGDVLIIPGYSFAASYNNYEPEDQHRVKPSLVVHHYAGTWKNEYGGEVAQPQ